MARAKGRGLPARARLRPGGSDLEVLLQASYVPAAKQRQRIHHAAPGKCSWIRESRVTNGGCWSNAVATSRRSKGSRVQERGMARGIKASSESSVRTAP